MKWSIPVQMLHCHSVSGIYLSSNNKSKNQTRDFDFSFYIPLIYLAKSYLQNVNINKRAIDDAAKFYSTCGQVNGIAEVVWALRALQLTDLTTLSGDDTAANVRRLCMHAVHPFTDSELKFLDMDVMRKIHTAAVCVYPSRVHDAYEALNSLESGRQIEIAAGKRISN